MTADVLHPVGLRLTGRPVVVVGGGPAAHRGVLGLLGAGAAVAVVGTEVTPALEALAGAGRVTWHRRPYRSGDLDGAWFALTAAGDPVVDAAVVADAERRRIFCTRADDPASGSATSPGPATAPAVPDGAGGRVVLVGGGPGDPGLITVRGRQALAGADVVLVDHLAPQSLLPTLAPGAEVVDASKLPRGRFMAQERINALLVEHARAGKRVVRLKGGDPFVFGRG
ncbi:SAM-dependent methyltransferase, partial [Blastococcus xanthinilyticus]